MKSNVFFKLLILVVFSIVSVNSFAQVRIGANIDPDPNAMLDLRSSNTATDVENKGVLFPRVVLASNTDLAPFSNVAPTAGMTVYNNGSTGLSSGVYMWNGTKWTSADSIDGEWFYMPSTLIDTSVLNSELQIPLFARYSAHINGATISTGAPTAASQLVPGNATDFYYYVIYDITTFSGISVDANGVMKYTVLKTPDDDSYINVIFVRK